MSAQIPPSDRQSILASSNRIVLASGNPGKLAEFNRLLAPTGLTVLSQADFNLHSADETGLTFVENAILKARYICEQTGLPALADDSGLEVDYLKGQPGIYSARYAGINASDTDNNQKLLAALTDVDEHLRTARYQCILVFMRHALDPTPIICQAAWEGKILSTPIGDGGFGYDPIFWVPSHQCSAAQLNAAEKNTLSHRGRAMQQLMALLLRTPNA
jgi:XTP/dITP diphosphohydrolase